MLALHAFIASMHIPSTLKVPEVLVEMTRGKALNLGAASPEKSEVFALREGETWSCTPSRIFRLCSQEVKGMKQRADCACHGGTRSPHRIMNVTCEINLSVE